jgi:tetratricopeptide (TPR) repeat protein
MQNPEVQTRKQAERKDRIGEIPGKGKGSILFLFVLLLIAVLMSAGFASGAEKADKKAKKLPPPKESSINDANAEGYLKKAEELLKKGEVDQALPILIKVHDYSEDVLKTIKYFQPQYEKAANDSALSQGEREGIVIKLKRMGQLTPKYSSMREASAYYLGYAYARKGDSERARKYLLKVLDTAPFSTKQDSLWMKSKKLLLGLYNLEGEF